MTGYDFPRNTGGDGYFSLQQSLPWKLSTDRYVGEYAVVRAGLAGVARTLALPMRRRILPGGPSEQISLLTPSSPK